jgi:hypothetical protein
MSISGRALLVAALFGLLLAGPAYAHAEYLRSAPGELWWLPRRRRSISVHPGSSAAGENTIRCLVLERPVHAGGPRWTTTTGPTCGWSCWPIWSRERIASNGAACQQRMATTMRDFSFTFDPQAEQTSTPWEPECQAPPRRCLAAARSPFRRAAFG